MSRLKRVSLLFVLIVMLLVAASCGESDTETSAGVEAGFSADDLYLMIDGEKYTCDTNINDIIAVFGEDYEYSEAISCAYDGMDKTFMYENVEFYTYPQGEEDFVLEIYCVGGEVSTSKGVEIGTSRDTVIELYGDGYEDTGYILTYEIPAANAESEGASLYFQIEDGNVSAIAITAEQLIGEE